MGSVVQTYFKPAQHAKLHATADLVFELRMSSPDGAVEHRRVNMVFASKAGAAMLAAATVARNLMLNLLASQSLK